MGRFPIISVAIVAIALLTACSVKEDRTFAPTNMLVDMTGCISCADVMTLNLWKGADEVMSIDADATRMSVPFYTEKDVEKGVYVWTVCTKADGLDVSGTALTYDAGYDGIIFSEAGTVDATQESTELHVSSRRHTAVMHVSVVSEDTMTEGEPVRIETQTHGLDLLTQEALRGDYAYTTAFGSGNGFDIRIHRQVPGSRQYMYMTVPDLGYCRFDLGATIAASGYDWTKPALDDFAITVNLLTMTLTVNIGEWNEGYEQDINLNGN